MPKTKIEWTEETWNFLAGCTKISPGCKGCYAIRDATRLAGNPNKKIRDKYLPTVANNNWTGEITFSEETLLKPLKNKKPTVYFVNSMSDLFHEKVKDEWIDKAFAVMALCPQHTFQILTKRHERMRDYLSRHDVGARWAENCNRGMSALSGGQRRISPDEAVNWTRNGLPNVWLGVSVENQSTADLRIPFLVDIPAAVRFLSIEPLLEKIDLRFCDDEDLRESEDESFPVACEPCHSGKHWEFMFQPQICENGIQWVIVGGESGSNARPMHPEWARRLRDQCVAAGVPFFFKQWGEYAPSNGCDDPCGLCVIALPDGSITGLDWEPGAAMRGGIQMHRIGKKKAGRILDGREWKEFPIFLGEGGEVACIT